MIDNYSHDDVNLVYITESIPGPYEEGSEYDDVLSGYNSILLDRCLCGRACLRSICKCLEISKGENYERYIINGELKYGLNIKCDIFSRYPMIECNSKCKCKPSCGNRVVQNGPVEGLVVKTCSDEEKGLGLFTSEYIHKGIFVCEYAGELLTKSQALARSRENELKGLMNYVFCLNEHTYAGILQTFVDPSKFGNIGRYINHSCEPNCVVVPVRVETPVPKLAIFACKSIMPDEELTFHYGTSSYINVAYGREPTIKKKCLCKTESCTGFLPADNF